jgi:hypothetical protein
MPKLPGYYGNTKAVDAVLKALFRRGAIEEEYLSGAFQNVIMSFCSLKKWDSFLPSFLPSTKGLEHMRPN